MRKLISTFCFAVLAFNFADGAAFLNDYVDSTNGASIAAGFVPDSSRVIVGEPLFLTFVASNRTDKPFEFCRVNTEIFSFTATNAAGIPVKQSFFHAMDGNGFDSKVTVEPHKVFAARLFLNSWFEFNEPGDYTVTCRCKFGRCFTRTNSFESFDQPIITVFKMTVLPSDSKHVTEIINHWAKAVETNGPLDEAAQALAEFNDPRIIPPLATLVNKNANNYVAVNALARFTNDAAADALAVVLKNGEDYEAGVAKAAIVKSKQADRIVNLFLPEFKNADAQIRIRNARAASWTGSEFAFAPLCALLNDETNIVRYGAAEAIGRLGGAYSFVVLTNCLTNSDFGLRIAAIKGLLALGKPLQAQWVVPIICAARNNDDANFRHYFDAIDVSHLYGGHQAALILVRCLDFDNPSVKDWYNSYLLQYIGAHWEPSYYHYYRWRHDPNRDGTDDELATNRQILSELKTWLEKQSQK
jgi:HEAT repeat protein